MKNETFHQPLFLYIGVLFISAMLLGSCTTTPTATSNAPANGKVAPAGSPLAIHGQLSIKNATLVDQKGKPVQLRGFSSQTLAGSDMFLNPEALIELRDEWKCDVIRAAMYVHPQDFGYQSNPGLKKIMETVVNDATDAGLYAIIDWHVLRERDPLLLVNEARTFFAEMAKEFNSYHNVIYEICNEPNGNEVTWDGNIRPYAEQVIAEIRKFDTHNLIIVGTPTWSQDVDIAAANPLKDPLVLYTMHFYAGTHKESLRAKTAQALKTIPVFCTEFGTTEASGNGAVYPDELKVWMDFLDANNISWCNWNLSTFAEGSAALQISFQPYEERMIDRLTDSGKLIHQYMKRDR